MRWGPNDEHIKINGCGSQAIVFDSGSLRREKEILQTKVVCFCDIPRNQLSIHTKKYSQFGISFDKQYLALKGANPVWYYGANSEYAAPGMEANERWSLLEENIGILHRLQMAAMKGGEDPFTKDLMHLTLFLDAHVLSFLKPFEIGLMDNDEKNYYMEREWRMHGGLAFSIEEVNCIFVPKGFAKKLNSDFGKYKGEVVEL